MFYATAKPDHGLPHDPFKAIIAPRPIGWITSMSQKGEINLAPFWPPADALPAPTEK